MFNSNARNKIIDTASMVKSIMPKRRDINFIIQKTSPEKQKMNQSDPQLKVALIPGVKLY